MTLLEILTNRYMIFWWYIVLALVIAWILQK